MLKLITIGLVFTLNLTVARLTVSAVQSNLSDRSTAEVRSMAANGDVNAQLELGVRLVYGTGADPDPAEGADWLRRAAENKNTEAQVVLAVLYGKGRGVPHDDAMSEHWMRQAAELGHVNGQGNLGVMFEQGDGVPRDLVEAYKWETLAASRATIDRDRLRWSEMRNNLRARLTPEQLDKAERAARDWMASFSNRRQR